MKCPKCGYISFDHNQTCPRCKKSLREEAAKMNLPDYKPAPPFLLASLVGEATSAGLASFDAHVNLPPEVNIEENVMKSGPRYEDAYEDMEINLDRENAEKAQESRFRLPGLAEAVAEMDSESVEIDENSTGAEEFILDEGSVEYAGEGEESAKIAQDVDETPFWEQSVEDIQKEGSGLELFDLSSEKESSQGDGFMHDDEVPPVETRQERIEKELHSLHLDEDLMEENLEEPSKQEIEFDPESYRQSFENELGKNKTLNPNNLEFEGISFDPAAFGLQPESRKPGEPVFTPDDLDFELLENDDDEKKS